MSSAAAGGDVEAGFAKLQGEDFEYYMQTYSIVLGRNSKKSTVDVDLSSLGGGMNISRHHARIFYDFARRRFALEVLGKNGCLVEGVLHLPGNPPVKLDSQDLLQIGDKEFYFLLPVRSILGGPVGPRHYPNPSAPPGPVVPHYNYHLSSGPGPVKKAPRREYYEEEFDDEDDVGARKMRRDGYDGYGYAGGKSSLSAPMVQPHSVATTEQGNSRSSNRNDPGWKYCYPLDESNLNTTICSYCGKVVKGGITRAKEHLMAKKGNVAPCPKAPQNVREELWKLFKEKESENNEELFNFDQAFSEGEDEEGYAPLYNIEDSYVGIDEELDD